jgi:tetratricopeptide (TPR) repeat protein
MWLKSTFRLLLLATIPFLVSGSLDCNPVAGEVSSNQTGEDKTVGLSEADQLLLNGNYTMAAAAYRNLIGHDNSGAAYAGLIIAMAKQDAIVEALNTVRQAKERFPGNANVLAAAAFVCFVSANDNKNPVKRDLYFEATKQLSERALRSSPDSIVANQALGVISLERNNPKEAIALFRRSVAFQKTPESLVLLAQSLIKINPGDREAAALINEALSLNQSYYPALLERAIILLTHGKSRQALAELNKIPNTEREARWSIVAGDIYGKLGEDIAALDSWRNAVHLDPYLPESYYHKADYYASHGKENLAVQELIHGLEVLPSNVDLKDHLLNIARRSHNLKLRKEIDEEFAPFEIKPVPNVELDPGLSFINHDPS